MPEVADGCVECAVACGDSDGCATSPEVCECCSSLHPWSPS